MHCAYEIRGMVASAAEWDGATPEGRRPAGLTFVGTRLSWNREEVHDSEAASGRRALPGSG